MWWSRAPISIHIDRHCLHRISSYSDSRFCTISNWGLKPQRRGKQRGHFGENKLEWLMHIATLKAMSRSQPASWLVLTRRWSMWYVTHQTVDARVRYTLNSTWMLRAPLRNCRHHSPWCTDPDNPRLRKISPRCVNDSKVSGISVQATHKKVEDPGRLIV